VTRSGKVAEYSMEEALILRISTQSLDPLFARAPARCVIAKEGASENIVLDATIVLIQITFRRYTSSGFSSSSLGKLFSLHYFGFPFLFSFIIAVSIDFLLYSFRDAILRTNSARPLQGRAAFAIQSMAIVRLSAPTSTTKSSPALVYFF